MRKTEAGTYLIAHEKDGVVREYDSAGKVIWEFDVPLFGKPPKSGHGPEAFGDQVYSAVRLERMEIHLSERAMVIVCLR